MEYGEGPIGEGNQHTTFHMSAIREETETVGLTKIHEKTTIYTERELSPPLTPD